jgi:hypothetical protein
MLLLLLQWLLLARWTPGLLLLLLLLTAVLLQDVLLSPQVRCSHVVLFGLQADSRTSRANSTASAG